MAALACSLILLLAPTASCAQAATQLADPSALILPDGGTVKQQGDRIDLYDAGSRRMGYGYARPDGSVDLFNLDGTRRATITAPIGGGPARVIVLRGKR